LNSTLYNRTIEKGDESSGCIPDRECLPLFGGKTNPRRTGVDLGAHLSAVAVVTSLQRGDEADVEAGTTAVRKGTVAGTVTGIEEESRVEGEGAATAESRGDGGGAATEKWEASHERRAARGIAPGVTRPNRFPNQNPNTVEE
jgi:hypothetical protein